MKRPTTGQLILWPLLALSGVFMLYQYLAHPDVYGYGDVVSHTGLWAAWLLMATLSITPIRLLFPRAKWSAWLVRRRRDFGVASFAYAALHTGIYLFDKKDPALILTEAQEGWLLTGWVALAIFIALAVTSNDAATRRMGRNWKRLHRLVYVAAILMFVHWIWSAFDPKTAWIHAGVLAAIELLRVALQLARRRHMVT